MKMNNKKEKTSINKIEQKTKKKDMGVNIQIDTRQMIHTNTKHKQT